MARFDFWRWLGPLGRYRPSWLRLDMTAGFHNYDGRSLPRWARLPLLASPEEKLLLRLRLDACVVYDVGAHTGAYTLFFSRRVGPAGKVVAFEPQPRSFAILERNVAYNRVANVCALPYALGDRAATRRLFALPGMPTTASLAPEAGTPLRYCAGAARVERLDSLIESLALPPPDFIKIDVEGMELDVLNGAQQTLARRRPRLLIEIHGTGPARKAERIRSLAALLSQWDYQMLHAESGAVVTAATPPAGAGHLYAQAA